MNTKYKFVNDLKNTKTLASVFIGSYSAATITDVDNLVQTYLSYAEVDINGKVVDFFPYDGFTYERRNNNNNFDIFQPNYIITGYTIVQDLLSQYSNTQKTNYYNSLMSSLNNEFPNTAIGVTFEDVQYNDMYVSVSLEKTFEFMDTLTITNNLVGSWPTTQSSTGVVYGKLVAVQNLKDENGNFIEIPLPNVPLLVFNKSNSDNIVTTILSNDDSSRINVNLLENSPRILYTTDFSYNFDQTILPTVNTKNVGDTYACSTITNANGEFILKDVPVGVQTLILEIDLLKQGLTPEEVALNIAPYPGTINLNINSAPHIIHREIPIQVLPSWGTFNTGYTNVDITMNIDLRKWATFFVPPVTVFNEDYDALVQAGYTPALIIDVKDMVNRGVNNELYPSESIECVVVPDITQRDTALLLGWFNEQRTLRDSIVFTNLSYNVFKLPANIYDPNGYKTDGSGNTISSQGVWLSSYQFEVSFNGQNGYRGTGFNGTRVNYDLAINDVSIGNPPFDKPWSTTYPVPYVQPKLPTQLNSNKTYGINSGTSTDLTTPKYIDGDRVGGFTTFENFSFGGWGAQKSEDGIDYPNYFAEQVTNSDLYRYEEPLYEYDEFSNGYIPNVDSIKQSSIYGYEPFNNAFINSGESYQRVECGHAYFMFIQGFPRILNNKTYDEMLPIDFLEEFVPPNNTTYPNVFLPSLYYPSYYKNIDLFYNDTLLTFDFTNPIVDENNNQNNIGYIYLYKIVDPDPTLLVPRQHPAVYNFANLNLQDVYIERGSTNGITDITADARVGQSNAQANNKFFIFNGAGATAAKQNTLNAASITIINNGKVSAKILGVNIDTVRNGNKTGYTFNINDIMTGNLGNELGIITVPANDGYSYNNNSYSGINYSFYFSNIHFYTPITNTNAENQTYAPVPDAPRQLNIPPTLDSALPYYSPIIFSADSVSNGIPNYYLNTYLYVINVRGIKRTGYNPYDTVNVKCTANVLVNGAVFVSSDNSNQPGFITYQFAVDKVDTSRNQFPDDLPLQFIKQT